MYDQIFNSPFLYSTGIHQSPTDGLAHAHWYMSFYPSLLRSETVKSFMVGYDMFSESHSDITPNRLRVFYVICLD